MLESHIAVTLPPTQLRGSQSAKGVGGGWYEEHGIFKLSLYRNIFRYKFVRTILLQGDFKYMISFSREVEPPSEAFYPQKSLRHSPLEKRTL